MLSIGSLTLHTRLILAPLSGISDLPFRLINHRFGCELAFCEMINVRSLSFKSKRTRRMLASAPEDVPLGVQLLGCEEQFVRKALDMLKARYRFDVLDFNAACPSKKVVRRGEGARLLQDAGKLQKLLEVVVAESPVPVTVKLRAGWDAASVNAPEVAQRAEQAGVQAVYVHGRTRMQGYSGNVDRSVIREVKEKVKIPVIASGDLFGPQDIGRMFEETGCDGVIIARGALGNPWIFNAARRFLDSGSMPEAPSKQEIRETMKIHLEESCRFYGDRIGVVSFRKFFGWYTRGFRRIRQLREEVSRVRFRDEMTDLIEKCS